MKFCTFDNESDVRTRANIRHFVEYFKSLILFFFVKKSKQSERFENRQQGCSYQGGAKQPRFQPLPVAVLLFAKYLGLVFDVFWPTDYLKFTV